MRICVQKPQTVTISFAYANRIYGEILSHECPRISTIDMSVTFSYAP